MNILVPSILSADFWNLGESVRQVEQEKVRWLHIDVMDGVFVPSISYGMPVIKGLRKRTELFFDIHLMIERPERYIQDFADCGADLINFHIEATERVEETIAAIRALGRKVGITIKPDTPVSAAEPYLELADMVLVMTVEPGFGGQKLMLRCLEKVRELRAMADARGLSIDIEVDGGICVENVAEVVAAGANVIVAGSAVFKGDVRSNVRALLAKMG
ncbi:MAG: ribulose-phosphate 3-epimerase [Acetatifactor sp.]|nr:ribulose-phosphate 3-epimerase [Acetatifactor sp.]